LKYFHELSYKEMAEMLDCPIGTIMSRLYYARKRLKGLATSQSIMIPMILMLVIMYSGMMVITSMGMEKENKTMETLLTLPVKRSYIVGGKMAGSALAALIMAVIYMIGF